MPECALKIANTIRRHWSIESAHWILDISFREDEQNADVGNIAENMSLIRHITLNFLNLEKSTKCGIGINRQTAGWNNEYLLKALVVKFFL